MSTENPHVLFICTGNYYRSRFAEAVFNYQAALLELPWRAISRGLAPHWVRGELSPTTANALQARGIALAYTARQKQQLTAGDLTDATRVIALKESEHRPLMRLYFPEWADRIEYWSVGDVGEMGITQALPAIERLVDSLIDELARTPVG